MTKDIITGKVIHVIDDYTIVIDKGSNDGVSMSNQFLVYYEGEELFDSETKESLGVLEIVCGKGNPSHIQEKITTIVSSSYSIADKKTVRKRTLNSVFSAFNSDNITEEVIDPEKTQLKFKNINNHYCLFKQIK